jgi:5-(carboxyamino)imidazole ribonucleotide synthase
MCRWRRWARSPRRCCPTRALETAQDRLAKKPSWPGWAGAPPFMAVDGAADLARAVEEIGAPGILKTRRDGYDGKGQWRIAGAADAAALDLPPKPLIYEGFIRFFAEFSVILVRGADGTVHFWDSADNVHVNGILDTTTVPAPPRSSPRCRRRALAQKVAEALDYVGVLTLEFFATEDGPVFNEMAPRVHNSGHWTIEGALTSQFENHIRAICGLPLGLTTLVVKGAQMKNLIGDDAHDWPRSCPTRPTTCICMARPRQGPGARWGM